MGDQGFQSGGMDGSGTLKDGILPEKLEDTDKLLRAVGELERTRHHTRLFAGLAGIGVPVVFGVRAALNGDPVFLLHALVVALFMVGFLWFTGRKYDRAIEELDEELKRISRLDS